MKESGTIARSTDRAASRTRLPRAVGIYQKLIHRVLGKLTHGRITLIDCDGTRSFGTDRSISARITVSNPAFYRSLVLHGSIGAADSYIRGEWETDDLVTLVRLMVRNREVLEQVDSGLSKVLAFANKIQHRLRGNTVAGSKRNITAHYDLSNDFYRLFLDRTMTYSAGIYPAPEATLEEASIEKLDRICRKLQLSARDHVLEIGGGWGSFAIHAARTYGCRVTTTTISDQQFAFARQAVIDAGLADHVTVLNLDYRRLTGQYDKVVSIEMIEAVGHDYVPAFIEHCKTLLRPDGVMALQAITMSDFLFDRYRKSVDFIQKYIFPGACLVSLQQVLTAAKQATDFRLIHLEDITTHYARTLEEWRGRFVEKLDEVARLGFREQFMRLWEFYLAYCEGGFRERQIGTVQLMLARPGYCNDTDLDRKRGSDGA